MFITLAPARNQIKYVNFCEVKLTSTRKNHQFANFMLCKILFFIIKQPIIIVTTILKTIKVVEKYNLID